MTTVETTAYRFATELLAKGAKLGVRDRAVAEIRRLATDRSVSPEAKAVYAEIIELEDMADQLD